MRKVLSRMMTMMNFLKPVLVAKLQNKNKKRGMRAGNQAAKKKKRKTEGYAIMINSWGGGQLVHRHAEGVD